MSSRGVFLHVSAGKPEAVCLRVVFR